MNRDYEVPPQHSSSHGGDAQLSKRDASRLATLWSGGRAAAGVAAGVALVGFLLVRGVARIPILGSDGAWFIVSLLLYLMGAVVVALAATEVMRLLLLSTPRPRTFFSWIAGVTITVLFLLPLISNQPFPEKVGTAFINLITTMAIAILVSMSAASAIRGGTAREKTIVVPSDGSS